MSRMIICLSASLATTSAHAQCDAVEVAELLASDGQDHGFFGFAVALEGDTAVVGAVNDTTPLGERAGSAYVFVRAGDAWIEQAYLTAPDGAPLEGFGSSAAIDEGTVLVGSSRSVYVFIRRDDTWVQQAQLNPSSPQLQTSFGSSAAIDGDSAIVGAPYEDTLAGKDAGSAYVFVRAGDMWSEQSRLTPSDEQADSMFGNAVAIEGDTVVIGAFLQDVSPRIWSTGAAYVFVCRGDTWVERAKLAAPDAAPGDSFGNSVAIDGDTILVGAWYEEPPGETEGVGAAYVFVRDSDTWVMQQKLAAPDAAISHEFFGSSVAIEANTAVVGAYYADTPKFNDAGAAYVFTRSAGVWTMEGKFFASDGGYDEEFGYSAAIDAGTALIGAYNGGHIGSAYVFDLNCPTECAADCNADGRVTIFDFLCFQGLVTTGDPAADCDGSGVVNVFDYLCFQGLATKGCG